MPAADIVACVCSKRSSSASNNGAHHRARTVQCARQVRNVGAGLRFDAARRGAKACFGPGNDDELARANRIGHDFPPHGDDEHCIARRRRSSDYSVAFGASQVGFD